VTHVAEERSLRAIELGERFCAKALLFVGSCAGQGGGDLPREQLEERAVVVIERSKWIESDDEHTGDGAPARRRERQKRGSPRGLVPSENAEV
jgi:hypothetical protein